MLFSDSALIVFLSDLSTVVEVGVMYIQLVLTWFLNQCSTVFY